MTDPEPASDFGYDLVHEDAPRSDRPGAGASHAGPPPVSRTDDDSGGGSGGDLGYDDAHDF
jgi:hypothetical protein